MFNHVNWPEQYDHGIPLIAAMDLWGRGRYNSWSVCRIRTSNLSNYPPPWSVRVGTSLENQEWTANHILRTTGSLAISVFAHSTYSPLAVRVTQSRGPL